MHSTGSSSGFTLLELVAIIVVIAVIGATAATSLVPSTTFQLQAGRDTVVAALFHAQQRALSQADSVRLTTSGSSIDIRQDANGNSTFESSESILVGSIQYPITLDGNVTITSHTLDYDRLGETTAATITVTKSSSNETVNVSAMGFAY